MTPLCFVALLAWVEQEKAAWVTMWGFHFRECGSIMSNQDDKANDLNKLHDMEKACVFKIIDVRDTAISYLRSCVRIMDKNDALAEATEKIKEVENQFHQIVSKINHWRRRLEYLADMKKYGWLEKAEEAELKSLTNYGANWEYYDVISSRLDPMRRRLAYLVRKQANKRTLSKYERAELGFFRNLGIESIESAEMDLEQKHVKEDDETVAYSCPAGGRFGYDFDSFEGCSDCAVRDNCSRRAMSIEEAFSDF